ncbi:transcriptional regulator domain-containing protein [Mesorhizobium sp.]|uniref:transcriptional regulator domain-containing protein n=1 Tax=Mesorhizobium sp. TaxID=1871066 RepID=UPI00120D97CF|nr:DUF6499 domain-containing protein [Mesorhizobium sp.]TIP12509.1 MAG: hypothetical protein E5X73_12510 [Mesorhizobium sp.]
MLSIDWRAPAAYKHTKHIPAAGFAWEYLRRNEDYRREYQILAAKRRQDGHHLEAFTERWGLRFRRRPGRAA